MDRQVSRVGRRWLDAFNRRDVQALVGLADPGIEFSPTVLSGGRKTYCGHQGIRDWISDLRAAGAVHTVRVGEVRHCPCGDEVILGEILVGDDPVSAFTLCLTVNDGVVREGHAYLTDDALLLKLGLTDV